ncbi:hypothetical protein LCGC14_0829080 [marine sediment metagenome]|uniref:Uncharacterized protein n=1 Tax=marine sediment metagenome TaxID=412755 RepID=A0A0F9Q1P8_9ZZZZ
MENDRDTRDDIAAQADALGMESLTEEQQAILEKPKPAEPEPPEPPPTKYPPADAHCPNCNGPGIRKGKLIICEKCDASFRYTKEGPKVEELGPFDKLQNRVAVLEGKEAAEPPPVPAQPARPSEAFATQVRQAANDADDDGI